MFGHIITVLFQRKMSCWQQMHLDIRLGGRGQARTSYAANVSNFSSTAHVMARYGWVNPNNITPSGLSAECDVDGFREVPVFQNIEAGNGLID